MPKGQDQGGVDRLRKRIDGYRKHHEEHVPRFDHTISCQNQQQQQETNLLRQRFLETNKTKKSAKKSEKKQHSDNSGSSVGPNKSNKRQNEDGPNGADSYEPPSKIGGAGRGNSSPLPSNSTNPSLYKQSFSQNGKRGGSKSKALDSQKYTASSSNHSKNGIGRGAHPPPPIPTNSSNFPQHNTTTQQSTAPLAAEFKKEGNVPSISEFADLDQCAAALEKDAKNGAITGSFGENSTDDIFNSDVFNDLISEISDLNPEVCNFYLDGPPPTADDLNDVTLHSSGVLANGSISSTDSFHPVTPITPTTTSSMRPNAMSHGHHSGIKMEGGAGGVDGTSLGVHSMDRGLSHCAGPSPAPASTASPLASQLGASSSHQPSPSQSYSGSHFVLDNGQTGSPLNNTGLVNSGNAMAKPSTRLPYSSPAGLAVDSPAAQTLKHMAEQHQHKAQMCMNTSAVTNGSVQFKSQGSVGSPAGSPYGAMGNYNGNMSSDLPGSGSANNMNPGSNCQVKQEVCSPGNPQTGFSPSPMMVDMASGGKRSGQHNGSSPSGQSSRIPNINSAGGSPIMSPISKSFNHPSPLNSNNSQGPISQQQQQQQQQQSQQNFMPMNRLPGPSQPYPNSNPRFSTASNSQISVASPKPAASNQGHVNDRGSPATQLDSKSQLRHPNPNLQQQQQQQQFTPQQFHYGSGQTANMPVEMGFNPGNHPPNSQMPPQSQQQQASGQTINFTQQHLRMGNQPPGIPPPRLPMPPGNRMGMPPRLPGGPMQDMQQQQQQQQQPQPRPHIDNSHPQRMMRPQRHMLHPTHQQMSMGGGMPPQPQQQMNNSPASGPMGGQMVNRFPPGMPGNPQMMSQQQQAAYSMGGNMPMGGGPNTPSGNVLQMRRPYGPGPAFQGMNPRNPGEQMLSSGSQNPHTPMGNPSGVPHNEWMGNMNSIPDHGSCPPYSGPQRHPASQQQMRPMPPQQYHPGMSQNQGSSVQGPPQMAGNFGQPHDHMMGQQAPSFNMGAMPPNQQQLQQQLQQQHHHQQQQQSSQQQQLPPNFSQHAGGPNSMKMGLPNHHPQQQQQGPPPMYGNANSGFPMKPGDNNMMCAPPNSMAHHPHMQQQQQQQAPPPQQQQQPHHPPSQHMYNMGNNNMMNSVGGQGQMNNNNNMNISDQQDFNLDLLVDGMRGGGDQVDTSAFNDTVDLLNTLDSVFP